MRTFHYFAPATDEQRAFVVQFLGAVLGLGVVVFFFWRSSDGGTRAMLCGAGLALIFQLGRAAWQLEKKARRAQNAAIGVDTKGLHLTGDDGQTRFIAWAEIQDLGVKGGRLSVTWPGGNFAVGSREIEDGMALVRLVMNKGQDETPRRGNFIPLDPR